MLRSHAWWPSSSESIGIPCPGRTGRKYTLAPMNIYIYWADMRDHSFGTEFKHVERMLIVYIRS